MARFTHCIAAAIAISTICASSALAQVEHENESPLQDEVQALETEILRLESKLQTLTDERDRMLAERNPLVRTTIDVGELVRRISPSAEVLNFDPILLAIEQNVAPDSWTEAGGTGRIVPFVSNMVLVVENREAINREVQRYVDSLTNASRILDGAGLTIR